MVAGEEGEESSLDLRLHRPLGGAMMAMMMAETHGAEIQEAVVSLGKPPAQKDSMLGCRQSWVAG